MKQSRSVPAHRHRPESGFTLVQLSVAVFIVGSLATIATPSLTQARVEARSTAVAADLRAFSVAFQSYAREHGDWPDGVGAPGAVPRGMEERLRATPWSHPTAIGGVYTWSPNTLHQGERYRAAIVLSSAPGNPVTSDPLQLADLDGRLDDGNLGAGNLRLGFRNYPVYVFEH